ncbi:hypothetical protein [Streptomyces sp. NPDC091212]|uniref:hypothetical protein n=1 Tax=Streptomyces sp. NPDC091212 TaxID=3155191 RepID=UPI003423E579
MRHPLVVRPGDRVRFDNKVHTVIGLSGVLVRLADEHGHSSAMRLPTLMTAPGFEVVGSGGARRPAPGLLDGLPPGEADRALWWHRHMSEILNACRRTPRRGRLRGRSTTRNPAEREAAKAAELSAETGRLVSPHTIRWRRRHYRKRGVVGMVDGRHRDLPDTPGVRPPPAHGTSTAAG